MKREKSKKSAEIKKSTVHKKKDEEVEENFLDGH